MSVSLMLCVSDAVAGAINTGQFERPVTAKRTWLPRYEPSELETTQVAVVPAGESIKQSTRVKNIHEVSVDVSVMQRVADDAAADELSALVDELTDHLRLKRLVAFPTAVWIATEIQITHSHQHLQEQNVFLSVFRVTYRVVR